jgi:hypothetical protein
MIQIISNEPGLQCAVIAKRKRSPDGMQWNPGWWNIYFPRISLRYRAIVPALV